jgi:hypothetical protein
VSLMEPEDYEAHDGLYAELADAYEAAGESLAKCQATGDPTDVEAYRADLQRARRLSDATHAEADHVMSLYYSRRDAADGS